MDAPRPGNADRGWNDPPIFNYGSAAESQASPRRSALNKRVAYPMAKTSSGDDQGMTANILNPEEGPPKLGSIQLLPPTTNTSTPTPLPVVVPTLIPTPEPGSQLSPGLVAHPGVAKPVRGTKETLTELLQRLNLADEDSLLAFIQDTLSNLRDKCSEHLKGRSAEDVARRIAVIQEVWNKEKLSPPVKLQLGQLVAALKEDNLDLANSIHLSLMVDYTNEVNQWMVGIKRLIQELQNTKTNTSQAETVEDSAPNNSQALSDGPSSDQGSSVDT